MIKRITTLLVLTCCLYAQAAHENQVTLTANSLQARFDLTQKGSIVSLRQGDIEVVTHPDRAALFEISVVNGTTVRPFTNHDFEGFEVRDSARGVRFVFSRLAGQDLQVTVDIKRAGASLDFQARVDCGTQTTCSNLLFPLIQGYESLSGSGDDDRYLLPNLTGERHHSPARQLQTGRKTKLGPEGYPGTQCLQMHALYNPHGGLVMYTPDPACLPKEFNLRHQKQTNATAWYVKHYLSEVPGLSQTLTYPVRIQACGPNWYDAADIYAAWSRQQWWMEKRVLRRSWLDAMPVIANTHDNEHYSRMLPTWYAEHQAEVNALMGHRPLINDLGQWEHYGFWVAPDSFPPLGGEDAMIAASHRVRSYGNHIKHLFSCGEYWMHRDITDAVFEDTIRPMAVLPRGPTSRAGISKQFPRLGQYVYMCPTAPGYHAKLEHLVTKLTDYHHDFISMDIWPLGQPRPCHNPAHDHTPGLGKWYVDANIELIKRLQAAVFAKQPQAVFGGESMTEPYLPWMHTTLMRSTQAPVERGRSGRITKTRIPLFDYVYGDQVVEWGGQSMSQIPQCKGRLALQFVRGNLINIADKVEQRFVDFKAMGIRLDRRPEDPVPPLQLRIELGPPELRRENYAFAARANDIQRGRFNPYFSRGRSDRFPEVTVKRNGQWQTLELYAGSPAVGVLRHPADASRLWVFGNGSSETQHLRLPPIPGKSVQSTTLQNKLVRTREHGEALVEITLKPFELAVVEWE